MSGVQSKAARLQKEHKEKFLADTEREMASSEDLKYNHVSAAMMKKFNALMEMQDMMFVEMRESLKNDLKEMLVKHTPPEAKSLEESAQQEGNESASEKVEEGSSETDEDTENLTVKSEEKSKLSRKQDKKPDSSRDVKPSPERMGEARHHVDEGCRESRGRADVEGEDLENGEKETSHGNKESLLKASGEGGAPEEGAVLRLAADFSSATLNVNKRWGRIFRLLKETELEPELQCSVKLAFKCDGEAKTFSDLSSLRQFASRKPFLKELLKDVLPQNEARNGGRNQLQERLGKTLGDTKREAGRIASDSLSFLFINEVNVASPNVKTSEEETLEQKDKETLELERQEVSRLEEGEVPEIEGEESSEEEASDTEDEEGSELGEEEEEDSELGEEGSELGEEEQTSGEEEEREEHSEIAKEEEASVLHETQGSTFQGLTVVKEQGVEKITRSGEEIGLISLVVDSDSEEGNVKTPSQTKTKETFHGLRELAFSYLVWDSKEKKLVKCQEGGAAAMTSQGIGTPCLTLYLASPSESLEAGSDGANSRSRTSLSVPSQVTPLLMNMEKGRYKTPQTEELTAKEADLIHETEENFRRSVIGIIRQMQREVENIKKLYFFDVLNMKSSMDDLNSLACMIEARVNEQEDAVEGLTKETMQLAKEIVDKERLREREDRLRSSNIRVIGIPEKENRENGAEDIIKEIIEENFAELEDQSLEIICAHRIPNSVDEHRLTPRHILVKFWSAGDKQKILKASRAKKEITYRGTKIRLTADLSPGTIDARSQWSGIIKVLQEEGFQPRILYPAKLAFDFKGKTKVFFDIEEFKKFVSDIPFLKELLNNII
ncbi:LINE-1 type transposase domain-containing protein 1 [Alexandromys fortis]|uniref:LINE-1 type transposase domain-containing protein 1 n=1 Tax=Alexandromys fortis TaxID=100897 RepID=UPI002153A38B|nr:LINE-1 type transposase domain-containing protein 1 [Microtus fortis]XP_049992367.1 LINE-1 type transposase domain-containing protein 1 [Microtus fortis]XP_049992368.1 LINE-1 type transposase domain-containing protein 1 [Microtus fortis]XP_049992369.1 LINE-1 type transposase domain-containing protein 1 [Microtus fortis]